MKKIFEILCVFFLSLSFAYAGGGITHMFIAQETIAKLPDQKLRALLLDNFDAYLVGAYYPDSGYIKGTHYGEDSHWDPFIYTFADYIKQTYPDPTLQAPKLVAFLFGCATHRVSDEIIHVTFYNITKEKDFNGDYDRAHSNGDAGIDFLVNIDKQVASPMTWWVPVSDLVEVYRRMGKTVTASEIRWGTSIIFLANHGERLIAAVAYPYYRWKMPWTAAHYYDWPEGGMLMDEQKVAAYLTALWQRLNDQSLKKQSTSPHQSTYQEQAVPSAAEDFAQKAIESGAASITINSNSDGSIELQQPIFNQLDKIKTLLNQLLAKLTN